MRIALASLALVLGGSCWDRGKEAVLPEPELVLTDDGTLDLRFDDLAPLAFENGTAEMARITDHGRFPMPLSVTDFEGRGELVLGTFDSSGRFTLNRDVCK